MTRPQPVAGSSVWNTGQRTAAVQRAGRYLPESRNHPGKMLPAIAAQAIATYTRPGDLVIDPMCGIGTTLVEAAHLGRNAVGVEYESEWAALARANIAHAASQGAAGHATVAGGDARIMLPLLKEQLQLRGRRATLVLTSPPYGPSVHGQVHARGNQPVAKSHDRYSHDPANLAHQPHASLIDGFTDILTEGRRLLAPGGIVAVTARPYRRAGLLIDIPGDVIRAGESAGLVLQERLVCLLARRDGHRLIPRASFFQLQTVREARRHGSPLAVIAHEDLIIFSTPEASIGSRKLRGSVPKPEDASGFLDVE
jgi:modification methylase